MGSWSVDEEVSQASRAVRRVRTLARNRRFQHEVDHSLSQQQGGQAFERGGTCVAVAEGEEQHDDKYPDAALRPGLGDAHHGSVSPPCAQPALRQAVQPPIYHGEPVT